MHRLVRHAHMQRVAVGVGVDGHGGNAHAPSRLDDPAGNFPAVGDEDFGDFRRHNDPAISGHLGIANAHPRWPLVLLLTV